MSQLYNYENQLKQQMASQQYIPQNDFNGYQQQYPSQMYQVQPQQSMANMYYNGYKYYPDENQAPTQLSSQDIISLINQIGVQPSPQMLQYMQNFPAGQFTQFKSDK